MNAVQSDVGLIAMLIAAFALAIGLVQVIGRLIESGERDDLADEPPDTNGASGTTLAPDITDPGSSR